MVRTRTAICVLVSVLLIGACKNDGEPTLPDRPRGKPKPVAVVPSASSSDAGDPWVGRQLADLRDRTLKWTPRDAPLRRMVFAGDTLFAILGKDIAVINIAGKADTVRHAVSEPNQLIALADGSVLSLCAKSTLRIRPNAKSPEPVGQVLVFPQTLVYGNAADAARLDVIDVISGQVIGFGPSERPSFSSLWLPDVTLDAPELKQAHCGQLLDGAYACMAGDQLLHLNSRSRPKSFGRLTPGLPVWRVLGSARADQVWIARNNGQMEKWWFGPPTKKLTTIQLPWTPLDVSFKGDTIGVVRIVQDRATPKQLTLVVLDADGRSRFERTLLPATEEAVNAAERELQQAEVVVHGKQPWVAVRTSRGVRVVHARTGNTLIEVE